VGDASKEGRLAGGVERLKNWLERENSDVDRRIRMAAPRRSNGIYDDIVFLADQRLGSGPLHEEKMHGRRIINDVFIGHDKEIIFIADTVAENEAGAGHCPGRFHGFEAKRRKQHVLGYSFDFHQ